MSQEQDNNSSKLLWKISGGLSALVIVAAGFMYLQHETTQQEQTTTTNKSAPTSPQPLPAESLESAIHQVEVSQPNTDDLADSKALVESTIIEEKVPENPTLAKEEIAKLDDIHDQLLTQQEMLQTQHQDADQLIELKEEQIKLLEEQLGSTN